MKCITVINSFDSEGGREREDKRTLGVEGCVTTYQVQNIKHIAKRS